MNGVDRLKRIGRRLLMPVVVLLASQAASAQTPPPAWDFAPMFRYNIENVLVNTTTTAGTWNVKVIFSVSNPGTGVVWDIKNALPYQTAGAALTIDIGWDPSRDITNTGSVSALLTPVVTRALGTAAALPVQIRNLQSRTTGANRCTTAIECPGPADFFNRFWIESAVTPVRFTVPPRLLMPEPPRLIPSEIVKLRTVKLTFVLTQNTRTAPLPLIVIW